MASLVYSPSSLRPDPDYLWTALRWLPLAGCKLGLIGGKIARWRRRAVCWVRISLLNSLADLVCETTQSCKWTASFWTPETTGIVGITQALRTSVGKKKSGTPAILINNMESESPGNRIGIVVKLAQYPGDKMLSKVELALSSRC